MSTPAGLRKTISSTHHPSSSHIHPSTHLFTTVEEIHTTTIRIAYAIKTSDLIHSGDLTDTSDPKSLYAQKLYDHGLNKGLEGFNGGI
jgi:hypothetical protein